jgi:hypothetical protein
VRSHLAEHHDPNPAAVVGYAYGYHPRYHPLPAATDLLGSFTPSEILARFADNEKFRDLRHDEFEACAFDLNSRHLPWNLFYTVNCSVRAEDFWAVGGFDESLHGWGGEDLDLAFRLHRRGLSFRISRAGWVIEWPHERPPIGQLLGQLKTNLERLLRRSPEPVFEVGWALTGLNRPFFRWNDEVGRLRQWTREVATRYVADEVDHVLRTLPTTARVAVIGSGPELPASCQPLVALEFDRTLLDQMPGRYGLEGHHAIGLRTPLPEQSVDSVIFTSRTAGLFPRWMWDFRAEAERIGRQVIETDGLRTLLASEHPSNRPPANRSAA